MTARRTRPRGFAPWSPRPETAALLDVVRDVLAEYAEHLPMTARQIFYRLVGREALGKTERDYARLCEAIGRARRAGLLPFEAIRDDGATRLNPPAWGGVADFLEAVAAHAAGFRLDRQEGQPVRLWLMCEAAGMAPMLARVADPYGVPVLSSGGFDSLTAKHALALDLAAADAAEVVHIGDHDPSGVHLFASLAGDVQAMALALGGARPGFTRLAVTPAQIAALGLPTAPPKATDRRAFSGETVQAEAIPPDVLARIARDAIEARQDATIRAAVLEAEEEARADLAERRAAVTP